MFSILFLAYLINKFSSEVENFRSFIGGTISAICKNTEYAIGVLEKELNQTKSEILAWLGTAKYGLWNGTRIVARQQRAGGNPYLVNVKEK